MREVGWAAVGLEGGWREVCVACGNGVCCDGLGGSPEEGMEGMLVLDGVSGEYASIAEGEVVESISISISH